MLTRLKIEGFRGLESLTLGDLRFINIFVGSNGSGKTSVLEAASLAANPQNPTWLATLNNWREMPRINQNSDDGLRTFFYGMEGNSPIKIEWDAAEKSGRLSVQAVRGAGIVYPESGQLAASSSSTDQEQITAIEWLLTPQTGNPRKSTMVVVPTGLHVNRDAVPGSGYPTIGAFYVHARRATSLGETASLLTKAAEMRTEKNIYGPINRVDPRVTRLVPGLRNNVPVVLADIGLPRLIPTNVLGDGFSRVLLMITGAVSTNGLLIVDEIDSGLYHAVMQGFWGSLLELRKVHPFQVFCSTHSEEMLNSTLGAFAESPDSLRIFRLATSPGKPVSAQKYRFDDVRDASLAGMEIR